jgi:hypothetical protein
MTVKRIEAVRIEQLDCGVAKLWDSSGETFELTIGNAEKLVEMAEQLVGILTSSVGAAEMAEQLVGAAGSDCTFVNTTSRSQDNTLTNEPPNLELWNTIPTSVLGADGTTYDLDTLVSSQTIGSVKQALAAKSGMKVGCQQLFLLDDKRHQQQQNLELKNHESVEQAMQYSESDSSLQLAVILGGASEASEFVKALSSKPDWCSVRSGLVGVAFVPNYPQLIATANVDSNDVAVINIETGTVLCEYSKQQGCQRLAYPNALAFTEDGTCLIVCENQGGRLQVLKLSVGEGADLPLALEGGLTVSLQFVRFIASSDQRGRVASPVSQDQAAHNALFNPRGIATRMVGGQERVLVADAFYNAVLEFNVHDGRLVAKYGAKRGDGDGEFHEPWDVAVFPSGGFAVADKENSRIQVFNREGQFVRKFVGEVPGEVAHCRGAEKVARGSDEGGVARGRDARKVALRMPVAITTDSHGNLIVAFSHPSTRVRVPLQMRTRGPPATATHLLQVFSEEGQCLSVFKGMLGTGERGIAWNSSSVEGRLAVAHRTNGLVVWG